MIHQTVILPSNPTYMESLAGRIFTEEIESAQASASPLPIKFLAAASFSFWQSRSPLKRNSLRACPKRRKSSAGFQSQERRGSGW